MLVNIRDWCKNDFEVVHQLRINTDNGTFTLCDTKNTPFFHHVALLKELHEAVESGQLSTYHFNVLRSILEKTASFHGFPNFSACIKKDKNDEDGLLYATHD